MKYKIIFVVLFTLSFSAFHDTVISVLDKRENQSITHYMNTEYPSSECAEFNELHNMFHFIAIVTTYKNELILLAKGETIAHILPHYASPLEKTSYKPPIA